MSAPLTVLQRVVLPEAHQLDTAPLYVDFAGAASNAALVADDMKARVDVGLRRDVAAVHTEFFVDRRTFAMPPGTRVSFASYFNAFPASYWRRWTSVTEVVLRLKLEGSGMVVVFRSNARGAGQRVDSRSVHGAETVEFRLPLQRFVDGGWYWFDLISARGALTLLEADWLAEASGIEPGRATLEITTMNKPGYCVGNLAALAASGDLLDRFDEILVVDQGTQKVADHPDFPALAQAMTGRLRVINQHNLGGSGGFARGMFEAVANGSTWVLLMDDDISLEPESLQRLMTFSDHCTVPTLVGAQMFDLYDRTVLHAFGESVDRQRWVYMPAPGGQGAPHDFAARSLRNSPELHRRLDVDYNGWWMELIPTSVIREIGLSLPVFIKWDDAEYGIRAQAAGYPTVTMPGAAVWHESWAEKGELVGWQSYFHTRNQLVAALLHSPFKRGGSLLSDSLKLNVKHLISMEYSTEALRNLALEDVLAGPAHLIEQLPRRLGEVRALMATFPDAVQHVDQSAFPAPQPRNVPNFDRMSQSPSHRQLLKLAGSTVLKQVFSPPDVRDAVAPQAHLSSAQRQWWRVSQYSSVLVSNPDSTGVSWHQRRPDVMRAELLRTSQLVARVAREFPRLREVYRSALGHLTSLATWGEVFEEHTESEYRA